MFCIREAYDCVYPPPHNKQISLSPPPPLRLFLTVSLAHTYIHLAPSCVTALSFLRFNLLSCKIRRTSYIRESLRSKSVFFFDYTPPLPRLSQFIHNRSFLFLRLSALRYELFYTLDFFFSISRRSKLLSVLSSSPYVSSTPNLLRLPKHLTFIFSHELQFPQSSSCHLRFSPFWICTFGYYTRIQRPQQTSILKLLHKTEGLFVI